MARGTRSGDSPGELKGGAENGKRQEHCHEFQKRRETKGEESEETGDHAKTLTRQRALSLKARHVRGVGILVLVYQHIFSGCKGAWNGGPAGIRS